MKKFGLIGGTSWRSTIEYYATINELINKRQGDNTNPPLRVVSLNQKEIHELQREDNWGAIADIFSSVALELQEIGVEGIALCASTPHKIYEELNHSLDIPVVHIADAIGTSLKKDGLDTAGLIGTRFTMSQEFIKGNLLREFSIKTIVPTIDDQEVIQSLIYEELSVGVFTNTTKKYVLKIIDSLVANGAQAVILGCTEFPLLLKDSQSPIPLIDSLSIHCEAIVRYIMNED